MIYKKCIMTINKNNATLDEDIYLFRLDKNIELHFSIVNNRYKFDKSDLNNIIAQTNAAYFQIRLYRSDEIKYTFAIQPTQDGVAVLTITDDLINDPIELGEYDFQISLLDADKTSMISMPIVKQQLHVCEPLVDNQAIMGRAVLGLSSLASGEIKNAFDSEGNYIREIHNDGDILSAQLINKFEEALDTNTKASKDLATKKYVDDNILLEQLPILRIDETNKRIYVNCNNMGTYKKYFVPNKYANVYGFSFIYTNEDSSETEIALIGGAMTRDDFILCARNTDTLFILILGDTDKYKYTKSTKTLEKSLYGYLKIGNTQEYTPTDDYNPATKKYVDDNKEYINYNDKLINDKISTFHISRNPVSCSTEINKKPLCELFPELLNMTYDTVFKKSISFKVNMDNFVKEYPTVKSAYNKIGINLYDENDNFIGNSYGSYINGDGLNIVYINTTQSIRFSAYFDKALVEGSNTSMETKNEYMTIQLSIPKGDNKKEFIDKIKNLKLSIIVFKTDFLNLNNESIYTPTTDYNPATKKYVDDKVTSLPQVSFNEAGELVVTINGVSKTFVPKS